MKHFRLPSAFWLGLIGLEFCAMGIGVYARHGFASYLWLFWLAGIPLMLIAAFHLSPQNHGKHKEGSDPIRGWIRQHLPLAPIDWLIAGAILAICAPLYLIGVHDFPRQMNTDEIAIMSTEKRLAAIPNVDIFGPSYYSDLPAFIFWLLGKIGAAMGGVDLGHMRLVHAASGVIIIVLAYFFLRMLRLPLK